MPDEEGAPRMGRLGSSGIDRFLGHQVKKRRLELGMTRVELAETFGISHQQMAKYERGTNQLSSHLLFSIAQLFGIRVSDLFDGYGGCDQELAPLNGVSNSRVFQRLADDIDINAGTIADGLETIEQVGQRIVTKIVDMASGEQSRSEALGHQEFVLTYKTYEPIGPACLPG